MYNSASAERIFDIRERTFNLGVRIIQLVKQLPKGAVGFVIADQLVRSGTSVGANVEEAQNASSRKEFVRGLTISLKESRETDYWLRIISETSLIDNSLLAGILEENKEITRILTAIVKNTKKNKAKE